MRSEQADARDAMERVEDAACAMDDAAHHIKEAVRAYARTHWRPGMRQVSCVTRVERLKLRITICCDESTADSPLAP